MSAIAHSAERPVLPRRARAAWAFVGAAIVVFATTAVLVTAAPAAAACSVATHERVAGPGWPQERWDLAALGGVSRGEGVTVAVLDSGVDATHPQLAGAVIGGGDFLDGGGDGLEDCVGHGTAVASIVAARSVDGAGLRGLAPAATILSIRVSSRVATDQGTVGTGDLAALIDGIEAAVNARPRPSVLNLSISTTVDSPGLRAAVRHALAADIVVVAAVGNAYQQDNPTPYPAAYDGVVGVGAVDASGARLSGSQVGTYVDIVAPGHDVLAAAPGTGHLLVSGTSFAVPYVAATAALIRARWPQLSRAEVVRRLLATADPPAGGQPSPDYGYGVVNPNRALTEVLPAAGAGAAAAPTAVLAPVRASPGHRAPRAPVLAAAGALLIGAGLVILLALATPAGRRRGWRAGG